MTGMANSRLLRLLNLIYPWENIINHASKIVSLKIQKIPFQNVTYEIGCPRCYSSWRREARYAYAGTGRAGEYTDAHEKRFSGNNEGLFVIENNTLGLVPCCSTGFIRCFYAFNRKRSRSARVACVASVQRRGGGGGEVKFEREERSWDLGGNVCKDTIVFFVF